MNEYLKQLNPSQQEAVKATDGPVMIIAGAGSGKTRVLTYRIAYLMAEKGVDPFNILSLTFTNKAAREMKDRIAGMLGRPIEGLWLGTFHSLSVRILRRHAERIGLKSNFTILDTDDQQRLLKQLMEAEGIDSKKWPAQSLMGVIQRWKDRGQECGRFRRPSAALPDPVHRTYRCAGRIPPPLPLSAGR